MTSRRLIALVDARARSAHLRTATSAPERGMSLVELMVALAIGMIILVAVVQIFAGTRSTYQLDDGLARLQENARFALEFINREVRMGGNLGCVRGIPIANNLNNSGDPGYRFNRGVEGFEAVNTAPGDPVNTLSKVVSSSSADWSPPLDASLVANGPVTGSDIIIVRHLDPGSAPIRLAAPNDPASFVLVPNTEVRVNDIRVATDCETATAFQVTAVSPDGSLVSHAATGTPGNRCATWGPPSSCTHLIYSDKSNAELLKVVTTVYYVGVANGVPTLFRSSIQGNGTFVSEQLIEGIENMQILYGIDTETSTARLADGEADRYVPASVVTDWEKVVSVQISFIARTLPTTGTIVEGSPDLNSYFLAQSEFSPPANDYNRRRVFTTTIQLRNRGV